MDPIPYIKALVTILVVVAALKLLEALIPLIRDALASRKPSPYRIRDDFVSPAEHSFYLVLRQAVGSWATICPKVSLGDLFYAQTGSHRENLSARNRIDRKHVDFVLCHPDTLRPLAGIELDDASHRRPDRQRRDRFVEGVFAAAGLPLARLPVRYAYTTSELDETLRKAVAAGVATTKAADASPVSMTASDSEAPPCPKCGKPMVLRLAKTGSRKGSYFWGCPDYPRCRGVREIK